MSKKSIGKIEKPKVVGYKERGPKIYLVRLLFSLSEGEKPSADYERKLKKYWHQVESQLDDLIRKLGRIDKIFHELVDVEGDRGMQIVKEVNPEGYKMIKRLNEQGAQLQVTEDTRLVRESIDWVRCLGLRLESTRVPLLISQFYSRVTQERDGYISQRIENTLKKNEIGILFIREQNEVLFPSHTQVFRIFPPVLDDIHRYLRDFAFQG